LTEKKREERGLTCGRTPARAVLEFANGGVLVSGDGKEDEDDEQTVMVKSNP
jgi:hypothetical protein